MAPILGSSRGVACNILSDKEIRGSFEKLRSVRHLLVHPRHENVEQVLLSQLIPDSAIEGKEVRLALVDPFSRFSRCLEVISPEKAIESVMNIVEIYFQCIHGSVPQFLRGAFKNIRRDLGCA